MKPLSTALQALFATRQFAKADLYTITLVDGTVLRFTAADRDLSWDGAAYTCGGQTGPYFDRTDNQARGHWKIGTEVDTLSFDVAPGTAAVQGFPMKTAARLGVFDGAELRLDRAFLAAGDAAIVGVVNIFWGWVAEIDIGAHVLSINVNSYLDRLAKVKLPRNLYQTTCCNTLYGSACGLSRGAWGVAATLLAGSTDTTLLANLGQPAGYFAQGVALFETGVNAGWSRTIKAHGTDSASWLSLIAPLPAAPAAGDVVLLYPGCDKLWTDGNGCPKFGNQGRFRGSPYTPQPETAL